MGGNLKFKIMKFKINKLVTGKLANSRLAQGEHLRRVFLALIPGVLLSSCVTDTLHYTPHPDRGAVRVTVVAGDDSRGGGDGGTVTAACFARVDDTVEGVTPGGCTLATLFAPGWHDVVVYNTPAGMTVEGRVATLDALADGSFTPCPDDLLADTAIINVTADDTTRARLVTTLLTRRLTLRVAARDGDPAIIASVDATLRGILPSVDMATRHPGGEPSAVKPVFVLENGELKTELNLPGIAAGSRQVLTLVVTATDGQQQSQEIDLTDILAGFNDAHRSLTLDAEMQLMVDGEFHFKISGWKEGTSGEGEAV